MEISVTETKVLDQIIETDSLDYLYDLVEDGNLQEIKKFIAHNYVDVSKLDVKVIDYYFCLINYNFGRMIAECLFSIFLCLTITLM